jgi:AcrR family transcriptional regulator
MVILRSRRTRKESKALTRQRLAAAGRKVFLRRGFHASSLEEIALEAGVTKGAVYSNFANKGDLFLAIFDRHIEERLGAYAASMAVLPAEGLESLARKHARVMLAKGDQEARWARLQAEVWTHASDDPDLASALMVRRDRMLNGVAALVEKIAEVARVEFALPPREVARAAGGLARGLMLERLLGPGSPSDAQFEDTFAALICGLARPARR